MDMPNVLAEALKAAGPLLADWGPVGGEGEDLAEVMDMDLVRAADLSESMLRDGDADYEMEDSALDLMLLGARLFVGARMVREGALADAADAVEEVEPRMDTDGHGSGEPSTINPEPGT
jgi:hypothetical protein